MSPQDVIKRGAMIVIEGADRVGKSTHAAKLADALSISGQKVELIKFPERTTAIGQLINQYLKNEKQLEDHVIHLLFSANRWEFSEHMKNALASGTTLIVDRYAFSGAAYSASKAGMSLDWCKMTDVGLPKPDLVLYMTLPNEKVIEREGFGDERYESLDFQAKVKINFAHLVEDYWKVIPADDSVENLHKQILTIVKEAQEKAALTPIDYLWKST